jgi:hypothetical protein
VDMKLSLKTLEQAVSIRRQIDTLERRLASLFAADSSGAKSRMGRRRMSAATRAKLAAAARARWAAQKAGQKTGQVTVRRKKGGITAAGRKRLSQLMKARWAARRKAAKR